MKKFNAMPPFNTGRRIAKVAKPFMRTWFRLMGRVLHLTPWSKSGQQNSEEEETAFSSKGSYSNWIILCDLVVAVAG